MDPFLVNARSGPLIKLLIGIAVLLTLAHGMAAYLAVVHQRDFVFGFVPIFYFDREGNLPTFYSAGILVIAAALSLAIYLWRRHSDSGESLPWLILGGTLGFLAVDEGASLHDQIDFILSPRMETSGFLNWPWVIPYAFLVVAFSLIFLPFFLRMPRRFQVIFAMAAACYVFGAIGLEMVGAVVESAEGERSIAYAIGMTVEELLEISGVLITIHGLIRYIREECSGFGVLVSCREA